MSVSELNSLNSQNAVVVLLDISIPANDNIRITNNNEDVVFGGNTYIPFPFDISELTTAGKGEVPEWSLQIDNTTRTIESYLQLYDQYLKINGVSGNGIDCTIYIVSTADLTSAILTEYFTLTSFSTNSNWATFKLGAKSPFTWRYPRRRILQNFCGWKFKSTQCGYGGWGVSCDKTLTTCRMYRNSSRFGGFPGIGKGIRL